MKIKPKPFFSLRIYKSGKTVFDPNFSGGVKIIEPYRDKSGTITDRTFEFAGYIFMEKGNGREKD